MGMVFSAFGLAYALFEIPSGWLGDRIGPRKVLIRVVLWWSFFTAATGRVWNLASLLVTRFMFGAGEAGCFPNLTKAFTLWLPKPERTRAQGAMWMSARWGGAFTPLLVVWVFSFLSWQNAFAFFGMLGVVWTAVFYLWFRDYPRQHPAVNAAELELLKENEANLGGHANVPWAKLVASPTVWLLWAQYFCISYGWYFYITWLPTYLQKARGMSESEAASVAGMPLLGGGFGCLLAGFLIGWLIRHAVRVRVARCSLAFVGCVSSGGLLLWSAYIGDPTWAMVALGLAGFANDLSMPSSWSACMDVGGRFAGTLSGSMNMMTNLAQALAPVVTAHLLLWTGNNWTVVFYVSATVYFVGMVSWFFIDSVTPLQVDEQGFGDSGN